MTQLSDLKGMGPARLAALKDAGITDLHGLLGRLPLDYINAQMPEKIADTHPGESCLAGVITRKPQIRWTGGRSITATILKDESGQINVTWFNAHWMAKKLNRGDSVLLYGYVREFNGKLNLQNPKLLEEVGVIPVYPPLRGLPGKTFAAFIRQALLLPEATEETLPSGIIARWRLVPRGLALRMAHFPSGMDEVAQAKRRLAFENLLLYRLAVRLAGPAGKPGPVIQKEAFLTDNYWKQLPFVPTNAQRRSLGEIVSDMENGLAMRRLVQGDVGSGKTAVALGAAACAIASGYQCAFMAPTDLLAHQQMKTAEKLLSPLGIRCGLLTGGLPAREKRAALAGIENGETQLVIGTHALISKGVAYHNLGLAITDEQHRFGVRQRQTLAERARGGLTAHILALSATPIPRTLYMALYADMRVSVMDELPPGRKPIRTRIVPEGKRDGLYAYIKQRALVGEQSFLVCPLVEDSEETEAKSAQGLYQQLVKGPLAGVSVGLIWGSQPAAEQEAALDAFYAAQTLVLVSTTVIEVGMDVPGATTMVVEDADRFGLAQLHQLRGRVGRGDRESWCFLLGEPSERLNAMVATNDGFVIAQKDLELRGPGEFLGTRQHGHVIDPYGMGDARLLEETRLCLEETVSHGENNPEYAMLRKSAEERYLSRLQSVAMH